MTKTKSRPTSTPTTLVVVSDLHCGSRFGVMPPEWETTGGQVVRANAAQSALHQKWLEICRDWRKPDILVVNGDVIDGEARKDAATVLWSSDMTDQVNCAVELLQAFDARQTYLTDGSGYHVKASGVALEHYVGEALHAEKCRKLASWPELFLKVRGTTFHFAHHVGVGTGWYKATPITREMLMAKLNESHKHKADIIVRSHVHFFVGVEFTRQRAYITPAWQLQTPYMLKKSSFGLLPDIGAIRFHITEEGVEMEKRFLVHDEVKPMLVTYRG